MSIIEIQPEDIEVLGQTGYRLVNAKFPPIELFNDVAGPEEFEALHALQALTNPRLLNEVGDLALLPLDEIPFGIRGCHYAAAPFTHVNPDGSRFSNGDFGLLYVADNAETALAEVRQHQSAYWTNVEGLKYDRIVFKGLHCMFDIAGGLDITGLAANHPIYDPVDYSTARDYGASVKQNHPQSTLQYRSVRHPESVCWALFSPRGVTEITQGSHYEMIWDGASLSSINKLSA